MRFLLVFYLVFIIAFGCNSTNNGSDSLSAIDSVKVIEVGVKYLYKHKKFASEFYKNPLVFVKSKKTNLKPDFKFNNQDTQFIGYTPADSILFNWQHPQPYIEIYEFKKHERYIELHLCFLTIGSNFMLKIKKEKGEYVVIPEKEIRTQKF